MKRIEDVGAYDVIGNVDGNLSCWVDLDKEELKENYQLVNARENKIPYLGICLGMQLSIIEFARNVLELKMQILLDLMQIQNPSNLPN